MLQQARNLLMNLDDRDRQLRFLIHDQDAKFPRACDALLETDTIKVIRTPVRAPNANAHMERWVGTIRHECLDRLLTLGRRQLEHVLRVYINVQQGRRVTIELLHPTGSHHCSFEPGRSSASVRLLVFGRRHVVSGFV